MGECRIVENKIHVIYTHAFHSISHRFFTLLVGRENDDIFRTGNP